MVINCETTTSELFKMFTISRGLARSNSPSFSKLGIIINGSEGIVVLVSVAMYGFYFNENIMIRAGYKSFLLAKIEIVRR